MLIIAYPTIIWAVYAQNGTLYGFCTCTSVGNPSKGPQ